MAAVENKSKIVFLHEVKEGPASQSYGIAVAQLAGVPGSVIRRARHMLNELESRSHVNEQLDLFADNHVELPDEETPDSTALTTFCESISQTDVDQLSPRQALDLLYELKEEAKKALAS